MTESSPQDGEQGEFGGYAESMAELESILASLEKDNIDIDTLASQVDRASLLIAHCKQRLRDTELSVQEILAQHESTSQAAQANTPTAKQTATQDDPY